MALRTANKAIAARCTPAELEATAKRAARLGLNVTQFVRQQTGNDPFTTLFIRLPDGNGGWRREWTRIEEDNLDGTYLPKKGAAPVAWMEGQPFAAWVDANIPDDAVQIWTATPPPT